MLRRKGEAVGLVFSGEIVSLSLCGWGDSSQEIAREHLHSDTQNSIRVIFLWTWIWRANRVSNTSQLNGYCYQVKRLAINLWSLLHNHWRICELFARIPSGVNCDHDSTIIYFWAIQEIQGYPKKAFGGVYEAKLAGRIGWPEGQVGWSPMSKSFHANADHSTLCRPLWKDGAGIAWK